MEKDRNTRLVALVALVVAVLGVSLGFASFTNTLTITSRGEVTPENNGKLNIDFAATSGFVDASNKTIDAKMTAANVTASTGAAVMKDASNNDILPSIDNSVADLPVIENLTASFTAPGQSVTFNFYAANVGTFDGYLKSINFNPITEGGTDLITCTARTGTTPSYVTQACEGIEVSVKVGSEAATTTSVASFTNHLLPVATDATAFEPIQVVISYKADSKEADGAFDIAIGNITLVYSTIATYPD